MATISDIDLIYNWSNDPLVRESSYNSEPINYDNHQLWYANKMSDGNAFFYIFMNNELPIGLVRIERTDSETIIGVLVDSQFRGKGFASEMLQHASSHFLRIFPDGIIKAYIKKNNTASIKSFLNAGFTNKEEVLFKNTPSYTVTKTL